ncbi:hypothetical protein ACWDQ0_35690 [Streptomyces sp. NPDC003642]
MWQRTKTGTERIPSHLRRWTRAIDIWIQDHHVLVVVIMFILLAVGAGGLLARHWDTVIDLSKDLAPVFTILSIIASVILGSIKWFRKRRAARLALQAPTAPPAPGAATGGAHDGR